MELKSFLEPRTGEYILIDNKSLSFENGSVNVISWTKDKIKNIELYCSVESQNRIDIEKDIYDVIKLSIDFEQPIFKYNQSAILKLDNKFYILDALNNQYDLEQKNNAYSYGIAQPISQIEIEKKIKFVFIEENPNEINVSLRTPYLHQKALEIENNGLTSELPTNGLAFDMFVNPIEINGIDNKYYLNTLSKFSHLYLNIILNKENDLMKNFWGAINQIDNVRLRLQNNFMGMTEEEIKKFKETIFAGNNLKDFVDFKFYTLINLYTKKEKFLKTLFAMSSGNIPSTYCIDNGETEKHELYLPFYFDKNWEIASNFYDLVYENNLIKSIKPKAIKSPNKLYQISEPLIPLNIQEVNISDNWKDFDFNNSKYKVKMFIDQKHEEFLMFNKEKFNEAFQLSSIQTSRYTMTPEEARKEIKDLEPGLTKKQMFVQLIKKSVKKEINIVNAFAKVQLNPTYTAKIAHGDEPGMIHYTYDTIPAAFKIVDLDDLNDWLEVVNFSGLDYKNLDDNYELINETYVPIYTIEYQVYEKEDFKSNIYDTYFKFLNNDFIINKNQWLKIANSLGFVPQNFICKQKKRIIIFGLFLPNEIYINNQKIELPYYHNLGNLTINYI
ncbi:htpt [Mycoplasmopsis fermentans]|nr:htpt [Mycoplasmopsis fermentans]